MRTRNIAMVTALALPFALGGYGRYTAHAQPAPRTSAVALHDDDDNRGRANEIRQQGRQDGMQAAYEDMRDGRRSSADHHREYKHPPVKGHLKDAYRQGFRDGYSDGMHNRENMQDSYGNNNNRRHHDDDDNRR